MPVIPSALGQYAPVLPHQKQQQQPLLAGHPSQHHLGAQFYRGQFSGYGERNMHGLGYWSSVVEAGPESNTLAITSPRDANLVDITATNTTN